MDEKKGISKDGLNNVFQASRSMSRRQAARKYNSLSPKAREEVNGWVNRAFYLKTGFPSNQKLDHTNPAHTEYVEEWLKQRDYVMGWNRNWEKTPGNLDTRLFRENIPATSPEVLRRKEGIFEQRMTPKEFNFHVFNKLHEAAAYDGTSSMLDGRRRIATDIVEKLFTNDTWVQNTLRAREGRNGLRSLLLWIEWETFGEGPRGLNKKQTELVGKLHTVLDPYETEIMFESITKQKTNRELFHRNFPTLAKHIKEGLEKEDFEVGQIYFRTFTNNLIEVRAVTTKRTKVEDTSYGTRGDPYVTPVITEKKDISIGGVDVRTGIYHDASFFEKHGTAKTDWETQLMIGEVAVLAGVGVRVIVFGTRATAIGGRRVVSGTAERFVGRELRDSLDDVAGSAARTGDTLQGVGARRGNTIIGVGPRRDLPIRTSDEAADAVSDAARVGDDAVDALGDTARMSDEASGSLSRSMAPQLMVPESAVRNLSVGVRSTLGEDLSSRALFYGYTNGQLRNHIALQAGRGLTRTQIRDRFDKIIQVHDALYEQVYHRNFAKALRANQGAPAQPIMTDSKKDVQSWIRSAEYNVQTAIGDVRFLSNLEKWKRLNPQAEPGASLMNQFSNESFAYAENVVSKIMGSSAAGGYVVLSMKRDTDVSGIRKDISDQKQVGGKKDTLPRIRDKGKTPIQKKGDLREKKL